MWYSIQQSPFLKFISLLAPENIYLSSENEVDFNKFLLFLKIPCIPLYAFKVLKVLLPLQTVH